MRLIKQSVFRVTVQLKIQMTSAVVCQCRSLCMPIKQSLCFETAAKRSCGETPLPFVSGDTKCIYLDDNFCLLHVAGARRAAYSLSLPL